MLRLRSIFGPPYSLIPVSNQPRANTLLIHVLILFLLTRFMTPQLHALLSDDEPATNFKNEESELHLVLVTFEGQKYPNEL